MYSNASGVIWNPYSINSLITLRRTLDVNESPNEMIPTSRFKRLPSCIFGKVDTREM